MQPVLAIFHMPAFSHYSSVFLLATTSFVGPVNRIGPCHGAFVYASFLHSPQCVNGKMVLLGGQDYNGGTSSLLLVR